MPDWSYNTHLENVVVIVFWAGKAEPHMDRHRNTVRLITGLLIVLTLSGCLQFRDSTKKIERKYRYHPHSASVHYTDYQGRSLRYMRIGQRTDQPLVVLVHGAPGSCKTYFDMLDDTLLTRAATVVAVDRLGYGYSEFGKSETSLATQAAALSVILKEQGGRRPVILVGHSFGGPVVATTAADYPDLVDGLVFLAPALDPENEKMFWFSPLGKYPPGRWLTPRSLKVAADEKYTHEAELELLLPKWEKIKANTTYIHGDKDPIVPYTPNMAFIKKQLVNAPLKDITVPKMNHYLPTRSKVLVRDEILSLIQVLQQSP